MKTVLLSAYTCCPNRGSEPGNGWSWIMGYQRNGYRIYCVTSGRYKKQIDDFMQANNYPEITFNYIEHRYSLAVLPIPVLGDYLHYYYWIFASRQFFKNNIKSIEADHIHHVTYSNIKFGTPVYDLALPTIVGPLGGSSPLHNSLKKYLIGGSKIEKIKQIFSQCLVRLNPSIKNTINGASLLLYSNKTTLQFLNKFCPGKVMEMFDAGLPDSYIQPYQNKVINDSIEILWVGSMIGWKGLNLAIETMKYLPPKYKLIVLGDGKYMNEIKRQITKLNLQESVILKGKLLYQQVLPFYKSSHLLLFPSLKDSCPMQVFEAMACGLPVVTLNHQGMMDQVKEGSGIKVPVDFNIDYPLELAKAIENIMASKENYHQFSYNAYQRGQQQIWSKRISNFLSGLHFN